MAELIPRSCFRNFCISLDTCTTCKTLHARDFENCLLLFLAFCCEHICVQTDAQLIFARKKPPPLHLPGARAQSLTFLYVLAHSFCFLLLSVVLCASFCLWDFVESSGGGGGQIWTQESKFVYARMMRISH